ncbi:uncharacterized protein B0H18DRAFT_971258 [Fomitopsis serialis]|uniref:uncharacterized protein n=1 Tax=Fomitopsis serialis TaxID=139415 RepID=UPI00200842B4|nr:uncharacterized protein B0H18DRAFT_971258 [Neoantrodia serialis]KAH9937570.1 hypothetical protein B0H18DRAFT_971258 [Neoantrodia serialis]
MSLHPAGLSSDTLDGNPSSTSSPPPMTPDQWSDTHDTIVNEEEDDDDDERDVQETVIPDGVGASKVQVATPDKSVAPSSATIVPGPPERMQEPASDMEATSVRSMPVVQVTEPTSPAPASAQSASHFPASSSGPNLSPHPSSPNANARLNRHRTALDTRASNRLSGFFSSLIHPGRRETLPPTAEESRSASSTLVNNTSRASSPGPSRPSTPPPRLPPPSLTELGLALSSITSQLTPSHANGPPTSGAFLKPHYLLLCHAQGLDVLPLVSPPTPQPYALIRRVAFKSVVIMEHRGVLVAIAGRRNGVRVYALEDIKRAVEWRVDVEVRREQDRVRREEAKRGPLTAVEPRLEKRRSFSNELERTPVTSSAATKAKRRSSISVLPAVPAVPPARTTNTRRPKTAEGPSQPSPLPAPVGPPPAYTSSSTPPRGLEPQRALEPPAIDVVPTRSRATSLNDVLQGTVSRRHTGEFHIEQSHAEGTEDSKADWASSDDEAINVVAAPSGSQMLDERTSSMAAVPTLGTVSPQSNGSVDLGRGQTSASLQRRNRPANLDLSMSRSNSRATVTAAPPSPNARLLTLQQALTLSPQPQTPRVMRSMSSAGNEPSPGQDADADGDADEEDDVDPDPSSPTTPTRERISLAEALLESRLPELPPVGTRVEQAPILIGTQDGVSISPRTSESGTAVTRRSTGDQSTRRRRRWSVLDGIFSHSPTNSQSSIPTLPEDVPLDRVVSPSESNDHDTQESTSIAPTRQSNLARSHSNLVPASESLPAARPSSSSRPSTSPGRTSTSSRSTRDRSATIGNVPPLPATARFLPRIITNAFHGRRSDDLPVLPRAGDGDKRHIGLVPPSQAPAPKLEYAKLPGTKGAVLVKAVETAKKSFLAILCGENGEKVELFAGTYRTALQLSRTFILPDSPRSLELQLQGDDLVEVFLVFTQNVFGLEPATVRVREVRVGRAERRAARRRARGTRLDQSGDGDAEGNAAGEEDTAVTVTVVSTPSPSPAPGEGGTGSPATTLAGTPAGTGVQTPEAMQLQVDSAAASTDELLTLAAAQSSPYSTFQQLTFAPNFPLASIADEYIIPPTYASFIDYRNTYEPEVNGDTNVDLAKSNSPSSRLLVSRYPRLRPRRNGSTEIQDVVHGPWKATLMQAWYRDGLLPPDLPVRREEDSEYILLKDLRLQCIDPTHPFRSSPPMPTTPTQQQPSPVTDATKPLLPPISLLAQPRHFGPPALFFSSRGGHSTTIVDARGRSVLKGRFLWTADEEDPSPSPIRLGDVKRLEAFDVDDRAVLVAMRQGGVEVVDFGDALLRPADHSRTIYPHFQPQGSSISRRGPFVWKIGTPLTSTPSISSISSANFIPAKSPSQGHRKKSSTGPMKSPRSDFTLSGDDSDKTQDEVLFLGRKDDDIYLCERRVNSFRILRLSPGSP